MAAVGEGTQAVFAPSRSWPILVSTIPRIRSVIAHMPLPICALPGSECAMPASTLLSS